MCYTKKPDWFICPFCVMLFYSYLSKICWGRGRLYQLCTTKIFANLSLSHDKVSMNIYDLWSFSSWKANLWPLLTWSHCLFSIKAQYKVWHPNNSHSSTDSVSMGRQGRHMSLDVTEQACGQKVAQVSALAVLRGPVNLSHRADYGGKPHITL